MNRTLVIKDRDSRRYAYLAGRICFALLSDGLNEEKPSVQNLTDVL
jgi:hypothetical protein